MSFTFFRRNAGSRETRAMKGNDETGRVAGAPEERISRLCAALGRIASSLDPETLRYVHDALS